jgi:hypothetical protein
MAALTASGPSPSYYYDRGRRQLASAWVKAPALGQWHTVGVVAVSDHIQASLYGTLYLDHRDSRFRSGRVGLWTKADSITAFDDIAIRGVMEGVHRDPNGRPKKRKLSSRAFARTT